MELTFNRLNNVAELDALRTRLKQEHADKDAPSSSRMLRHGLQASGSNKLVKKFEEEAAAKGGRTRDRQDRVPGILPARSGRDPGAAGDLLSESEGVTISRPVLRDRFCKACLIGNSSTAKNRLPIQRGDAGHPVLYKAEAYRSPAGTGSSIPATFTIAFARTDMRVLQG